jgi:hypothetical protein
MGIYIFLLVILSIISPIIINNIILSSNELFLLGKTSNFSAQDLYNKEWFNFFGNYLSFLGTVILGIAAFWQNERIRKLENRLINEQQSKEKQNKAIDFTFLFTNEVLPKINKLDKVVGKFGIENLGKIQFEYSEHNVFPYKLISITDGNTLDRNVKKQITDFFNILEPFSIIIINDLVDQSIIKSTISGPIVDAIEKYMIYLMKFTKLGKNNSFKPIFQLYFYWKFNDLRIKNLSQESLSCIFNFDDRDNLVLK